ncbi:hypothetical protein HZH68_010601 [Vespula germanica]|uniref:Ig-like domain-containing protein n=1 Tax=Vespula germanica TaxID=30212 RepID=A0A834N2C0_VESGE|nr:hypothetical protein HZH68_010601 [Vespula germanica]
MPGFLKSKDAQQASAGNPVPLVNISVVEGKPAELPCDITPPGEDTLHMVFWFKDEAGVPLYTEGEYGGNEFDVSEILAGDVSIDVIVDVRVATSENQAKY